jgi:hypothetical protein
MILDAGCGNRCMWEEKSVEGIIYTDCETKLQRKPTIFSDCRCLPFQKETFDTIFFDPPHAWGMDNHVFFSFPNTALQQEKYPDYKKESIPSYYGVDRYKSRSQLVAYLYRAEKELKRVLKIDGILWLRWSNLDSMDEHQALNIFNNWHICTRHEVVSSMSRSESKSFWFMLMKKPLTFIQPELELS